MIQPQYMAVGVILPWLALFAVIVPPVIVLPCALIA